MEDMHSLLAEFGRKVGQTQEANNAALTQAAETLNTSQATRSTRMAKALDDLAAAGRDLRAAQAKQEAAIERIGAIEAETANDSLELQRSLLYLRKMNEGVGAKRKGLTVVNG